MPGGSSDPIPGVPAGLQAPVQAANPNPHIGSSGSVSTVVAAGEVVDQLARSDYQPVLPVDVQEYVADSLGVSSLREADAIFRFASEYVFYFDPGPANYEVPGMGMKVVAGGGRGYTIPWHLTDNNCEDRKGVLRHGVLGEFDVEMGTVMTGVLGKTDLVDGAEPIEIIKEPGVEMGPGWDWHVAGTVKVLTPTGALETLVIDPSMSILNPDVPAGPLTVSEWTDGMEYEGSVLLLPGEASTPGYFTGSDAQNAAKAVNRDQDRWPNIPFGKRSLDDSVNALLDQMGVR
jgi:hypothetical protein